MTYSDIQVIMCVLFNYVCLETKGNRFRDFRVQEKVSSP